MAARTAQRRRREEAGLEALAALLQAEGKFREADAAKAQLSSLRARQRGTSSGAEAAPSTAPGAPEPVATGGFLARTIGGASQAASMVRVRGHQRSQHWARRPLGLLGWVRQAKRARPEPERQAEPGATASVGGGWTADGGGEVVVEGEGEGEEGEVIELELAASPAGPAFPPPAALGPATKRQPPPPARPPAARRSSSGSASSEEEVLDMTELADSPGCGGATARPAAAIAWQTLFRQQQDRSLAQHLQQQWRPLSRVVSAIVPRAVSQAPALAPPPQLARPSLVGRQRSAAAAGAAAAEREASGSQRGEQELAAKLGLPLPTLQALMAKRGAT